MTKDEIERLEALEKAATAGPWECGRREAGDSPAMVYCDDATGQRVADCTGQYLFFSQAQKEANAAFIAAIRNAAPDLIAAARREVQLVADLATAEARISELEAFVGEAEKFIEPFTKGVFNDNGDMSVTAFPRADYDTCCNAYFLRRRAARLLTGGKNG